MKACKLKCICLKLFVFLLHILRPRKKLWFYIHKYFELFKLGRSAANLMQALLWNVFYSDFWTSVSFFPFISLLKNHIMSGLKYLCTRRSDSRGAESVSGSSREPLSDRCGSSWLYRACGRSAYGPFHFSQSLSVQLISFDYSETISSRSVWLFAEA